MSSRWKITLWCAAVVAVALVPWMRNHDYLRDFYDYGMFVNVNARLDAGQKPFVDFTTPAQSATFVLNHLAERLGGGSYVGLTRGAATLIVLIGVALVALLARRWPPALAAVFGFAIVACSASQHTIIFYNPIGVFAMALVVWSFAVAPVWSWEQRGWHALAAAGLLLGGLNKINFHLLSCAMALGWLVWGAIEARASWRRIGATLALIVVFGGVLPLAIELAWTGADWRTWYHNVVQLPLGARGDRVGLLKDARVYFSTLHDYYGSMRLAQSGLVVLLLPLGAVIAAWFTADADRPWMRRGFALLAGVCGALAGAALLLTNNEIAYLTIAAALVMLAGLWLGFRLPVHGWWPRLALGLPALIVGLSGWESAWLGQRSQFGHAQDPRAEYVAGETLGPEFAYLRGLHIPPGMARSLVAFAHYRRAMPSEADRVFYGPGVEWLERIWPAPKVRGMPLIASAFESEREMRLLEDNVISGGPYGHILVVEAWNSWPLAVQIAFFRGFSMERIGNGFFLYHRLRPGVLWARPLNFYEHIGGNVESTRLISHMPKERLADGRLFVGIDRGSGELEIAASNNRSSAEAVLRRRSPGGAVGPVRFEAFAAAGEARFPRWSREITLPENQDELVVPTGQIDASGHHLLLRVTVPAESAGAVTAGWREPRLWDTVERASRPPLLQEGVTPISPAPKGFEEGLLPATLRGSGMLVRDPQFVDGKFWLNSGGELWIPLPAIFRRIDIKAHAAGSPPGTVPQLRVAYYKGGRLEMFIPQVDEPNNTARFSAWSCEAGGWLAILADPHRGMPPFTVEIVAAER